MGAGAPLEIPLPLSYPSPVKVRLLDHTKYLVVALWKVLYDDRLHLLCPSLFASRIFPLCSSYPHCPWFSKRAVQINHKSPFPCKGKRRIDPFCLVQIFELMPKFYRFFSFQLNGLKNLCV
jgi:hypothetical protein